METDVDRMSMMGPAIKMDHPIKRPKKLPLLKRR
jgi:hypothetical protein